MSKSKTIQHCLWCGKPVKQAPSGRKKIFCNDNHRNYYFKKKKQGKTGDVMEHLGFKGSVQYSTTDDILHGKLLNTPDLITYEGKTLDDLKKDFIKAVNDYTQTKESLNKKDAPTKTKTSGKPFMNDAIKKKLGLTK